MKAVLTDAGRNSIQVIMAIREVTGIGLTEARQMTDKVPQIIKQGIDQKEAESIKKLIEAEGGIVEIQE